MAVTSASPSPDGWHLASAHGQEVGLRGPAATVEAVADLAAPWVRIRPFGAADLPPSTPAVVVGDGEAAADCERWGATLEGEEPRALLLDHRRRRIHVLGEPGSWQELQVLRAVRNLLRWSALSAGLPCLHAGMVEIQGAGIAIAGGKRAGKTSTILGALAVAGAGFVSNDDVTLVPSDGGWRGVGWPRSVNLRRDAVTALCERVPALSAVAELRVGSRHPSRRGTSDDDPEGGGDDFTVLPEELCAAVGVPTLASAPLAAVVLPRFSDVAAPTLEPLAPDEAAAALIEQVDRVATDHDDYLAEWFEPLGEAGAEAAARAVADAVPCFRLRQRLDAIPEAVRALSDAAAASRARAGLGSAAR